MRMENLTIGLKNSWAEPGPNNPYEAKLSLGYQDNKMHVKLSDEVALKILQLAADEIAAAAKVQIDSFVRDAIAINQTPLLDHE
jgi:hypothetical protein